MAVTYEQLMKVPFVMKVVKKLYGPGNLLQRFYGLGPLNTPQMSIQGRVGVYDIFNETRTLFPVRSPMSPPARLNRKPVGQQTIAVQRSYGAITIADEEVFRTRPLGGQYSNANVDQMGQQYIARQIRYGYQRLTNNHEFMAAMMFRGGWSLKPYGEDLFPVPQGTSGTVHDVDTLVPSEHQTDLDTDDDSNPIIGTNYWTNTSTDITAQLYELQARHARYNGNPLKHIWMNGITFKELLNNSKLQAVGGTAYRIFDTLTLRERDPERGNPTQGETIVFRALPNWQFHVYNDGWVGDGNVGEDFDSQISKSNWNYFIPTNKAIITPDPGDWCGLVAGSEPIQWSRRQSRSQIVTGYGMGIDRDIDPPRYDIKYLSNTAPVLFVERSVYYATVGNLS